MQYVLCRSVGDRDGAAGLDKPHALGYLQIGGRARLLQQPQRPGNFAGHAPRPPRGRVAPVHGGPEPSMMRLSGRRGRHCCDDHHQRQRHCCAWPAHVPCTFTVTGSTVFINACGQRSSTHGNGRVTCSHRLGWRLR